MLLSKILCNLFGGGKRVSINCKNIFAKFVLTSRLKDGLNQIIFRFFLLVLFFCKFDCMYCSFALKTHLFSATSLFGFDCSNVSSLEDNFSVMVSVRCSEICGG